MLIDIGEMKRHIKPKADSTLRNMRKDDLIQYIRCLENNYNVSVSFNENQAKYIESLDSVPVVRGRRLDCGDFCQCSDRDATMLKEIETNYGKALWIKTPYCPNCGARMDGDTNG